MEKDELIYNLTEVRVRLESIDRLLYFGGPTQAYFKLQGDKDKINHVLSKLSEDNNIANKITQCCRKAP